MIVVPTEQLSQDVVQALIEEFVTRHGAIQGEDVPLNTKVSQVQRMLTNGHAVIVWDEETESATILTREELEKLNQHITTTADQDTPQ